MLASLLTPVILQSSLAQDESFIPKRGQVCAVVPFSLQSNASKVLRSSPDFNSSGFREDWIIEYDDQSIYVYSKDDPAIRYYANQLKSARTVLGGMRENLPIKLSELPDSLRKSARNALERLGNLPDGDDEVSLGIMITERYILENKGRQVKVNLREKFGTPSPLSQSETQEDSRPSVKPSSDGDTAFAGSDLAFVRVGFGLDHQAHADLSVRAFQRYAEFVGTTRRSSMKASREMIEYAMGNGELGLNMMAFDPTEGFQIDEKRRRAMLEHGIPGNRGDGIDDLWIHDSKVIDHYYVLTFSVRYAALEGMAPVRTEYGIPFRIDDKQDDSDNPM